MSARASSDEFQALLDAAVDAIVVIDARGRIVTFNVAAERLFGHRADDVLGKSVDLLMPEPHRSKHAEYLQRYAATGERHVIGVGREVPVCRADGSVVPVYLSVGEAAGAGGTRFVGILHDLSARHAAEQRARDLEGRLEQLGRFNLLGEMAAGIAHEINQPLTAIASYAQAAKRLLDRGEPGAAQLSDVLRKIDEQARRAGDVLANLRKLIRKQAADTQALDVNAVIADVADLIEADASSAGIPLAIRYGIGVPQVRGNAIQLQQVVLNLTRNAVDAMRDAPHKELGIALETLRTRGGSARITVADRGHGVPRELGAEIFHPFVTTKRTGLGVGLAISRSIVQAYGGSLNYTDNPDGGTTFAVELPALAQE